MNYKRTYLLIDIIIGLALAFMIFILLQGCTPSGVITKDQLRDSVVIKGPPNIKIYPGDITIERALQIQDSLNQLLLIDYQKTVDNLQWKIYKNNILIDSLLAPPLKENDYSDTVTIIK